MNNNDNGLGEVILRVRIVKLHDEGGLCPLKAKAGMG
jgi:hypothetical protein